MSPEERRAAEQEIAHRNHSGRLQERARNKQQALAFLLSESDEDADGDEDLLMGMKNRTRRQYDERKYADGISEDVSPLIYTNSSHTR